MSGFDLQAEMAKLPEPPANSRPPYWDYWRHDLWQLAQSDEPSNFMKWPPIYHCMLQDHWPDSISAEAKSIPAPIAAKITGFAMTKDPATADSSWRNLIHQTYHILRWQEATGLRIADLESIYEFGGGYGAMALVCNQLGFKGKYYIYDLPEFSLLQRWYLEECGVDNVHWHGWKDPIADTAVDLVIACYSLSEMNYGLRGRLLNSVPAHSYLFLYSNRFEEYDNIEYFQNMEYADSAPLNWRHEHIEHLPPESWYTWGW